MNVPPLSDADLREMLARPLIAKVATVSSKGVRVTPMWFGTDGDTILLNTHEDTAAVRNLRSRPRCSVMIDSDAPPMGVHYWGRAGVTGPENDAEGITRMLARYFGGDTAVTRAFVDETLTWGKRLWLRFQPERTLTWDLRRG